MFAHCQLGRHGREDPRRPGLVTRTHVPAPIAFVGLFLAAFVLRLPVLFDSVVDWDESIYLLVADDVLRGRLPYTATFDHKPPVLYYVFALAELAFGRSTVAIRILGALCVATSALALASVLRRLGAGPWSRALAALAFIMLCLANGGLATNAELVMMALAHGGGALFFAARDREAPLQRMALRIAAGVAFALACGTKLVVAFDVVGIVALNVVTLDASSWRERAKHSLAQLKEIAFGVCAGVAVWVAPHWIVGEIARLREVVFDFNFRYAALAANVDAAAQWCAGAFPFAGALLAVRLLGRSGLGGGASGTRRAQLGCALWLGASLCEVALTGRYHGHYFLVLAAPLALLVGRRADAALASPRLAHLPHPAVALTVLALVFALGPAVEYKWRALRFARNLRDGDLARDDLPRQVAREIAPELAPRDEVYAYNFDHVLYHLVDRRSPTPYAFSDLLNDPRYPIEALGVDRRAEVARVLAREPAWIVVHERPEMYRYPTYPELDRVLREGYAPASRRPVPFHSDEAVVSYRRRP
jgi:4-amino-4-deoxy-L-arabinose transferase-like glycosyltransferase